MPKTIANDRERIDAQWERMQRERDDAAIPRLRARGYVITWVDPDDAPTWSQADFDRAVVSPAQ